MYVYIASPLLCYIIVYENMASNTGNGGKLTQHPVSDRVSSLSANHIGHAPHVSRV